jgi:hypothetical protein
MSTQMTISILVIAIGAQNESAVNNQTMMMPGGLMTFGSSLDNARMHLMEAIMDLNEGDIKGAIMQLNMTDQGIKMHEKEMMDMKNGMKANMSTTALNKTQNESS